MSILDRLLRKQPPDPSDRMIEWLSDKSSDDRRFVVGILYGGPFSLKVWKWMLSQPGCDKGTAAMLLWTFGWPQGLIRAPDPFPLNDRVKSELIGFIVDRWKDGKFAPGVFSFDPTGDVKAYRRALRQKGIPDPFGIPEEAWLPLHGRPLQCSSETDYRARESSLAPLLGDLRIADLAAVNPTEWEPIRRRRMASE